MGIGLVEAFKHRKSSSSSPLHLRQMMDEKQSLLASASASASASSQVVGAYPRQHQTAAAVSSAAAPAVSAAGGFNGPRAVLDQAIALAEHKAHLSIDQLVVIGLQAGMMVAFGGFFAYAVAGDLPEQHGLVDTGLQRLLVAVTFPLNIVIILFTGLDLFTGNCFTFPVALFARRVSLWKLIRAWVVSWTTNFLGALFVAVVFAWLPWIEYSGESKPGWLEYVVKLAEKKVSPPWYQLLIHGVAANWMVCLSVHLAMNATDAGSKILGCCYPIAAFIVMGFEHSIANCFTIPTGMLHGANVTIPQFLFYNLPLVTLGNIIGGMFFVAIPQYYVNILRAHQTKDEGAAESQQHRKGIFARLLHLRRGQDYGTASSSNEDSNSRKGESLFGADTAVVELSSEDDPGAGIPLVAAAGDRGIDVEKRLSNIKG